MSEQQSIPAPRAGLADGQWHRLHPATPLLKGGIWLVAVLGFLAANLRETILAIVLPDEPDAPPDEPGIIAELYVRGQLGLALGAVLTVLIVALAGFWLSWRRHSFRITSDAVQVRSGILFTMRRDARLDRVQGVAIQRPVLARLLGASRIEIGVAGQDATVPLAYLRTADADALRRDILTLASGARPVSGAPVPEPAGGIVARRVGELLAPELPENLATPESVVRIPPLRLAGSLLASGFTFVAVALALAVVISTAVYGHVVYLFLVVPAGLALAGLYVTRFTRSLRFSIARTDDGVRVGYGLLSTSNDTLPPGRVHAVGVTQPLLWRPFGWWTVRVNRAGQPSGGSGQLTGTVLLPVGTVEEVVRVLALLFTDEGAPTEGGVIASIPAGLTGGLGDGFSAPPARARLLRPFSWSRTGYRFERGNVLLRSGVIWRRLSVVPLARVQSVELRCGPARRVLRLAAVRVHTVAGPVRTGLPIVDGVEGASVWEEVARRAVDAAAEDRSHRWAESRSADRLAHDQGRSGQQ